MIETEALTRDGFTAVFNGNRVDVYQDEAGDRILLDTLPVDPNTVDDMPSLLGEVLDLFITE